MEIIKNVHLKYYGRAEYWFRIYGTEAEVSGALAHLDDCGWVITEISDSRPAREQLSACSLSDLLEPADR